jgi:hypothetical protein
MKAFIDKVFKMKKLKKEELLDEETITEVKEQATKTNIKAIKVEEPKEVFAKPGHYFADCNCFKCIRWRNQSA